MSANIIVITPALMMNAGHHHTGILPSQTPAMRCTSFRQPGRSG